VTQRILLYQHEADRNWYAARCRWCQKLVAFVTDEASYSYPDQALLTPVVHNCPCTCSTNPYNCPQGQALVQAIHTRKGDK
jgi:hypothetical protein